MPAKTATPASTTEPVAQFETALQELDRLVQQLERGELPLEQALQAFERGNALANDCRKALEAAELKIATLTAQAEANSAA